MSGKWQDLGDWQVGRVNGEWVVLARGGAYTPGERADLPLRIVATCPTDLDAQRITRALRAEAERKAEQ